MATPTPPLSASTVDDRLSAVLASDQFSVASYLNLALESAPDPSSRLAELALQLQLSTQACHEDIGRISAELQAILPRAYADVGRVGVGLEGLAADAEALASATAKETTEDVSHELETLSTLHALQSNLSRTLEILHAAATWDTTLASIAPLLASHNLTSAVSALAELESGERALRGMPGVDERQASIGKIRQQVSSLLQPQLQHALANMSTRLAPLQQCVEIYTQLDQVSVLQSEYTKHRPASIHKLWFDFQPRGEFGSEAAAESFAQWLPTWLDAVLQLIGEERRQLLTVFGAESVAEMTLRVLAQCFKPILPSFKSRLESLCSSAPSVRKGSLARLCAVYEAILQFLSLVYENIIGGWMDMVESGTVQTTTEKDCQLYSDLTDVLVQITTPFAPYQERLAELEAVHSAAAMQELATRMQAAAKVEGASIEGLQSATDTLQRLASAIVPVAEGALARFELLKGGYGSAAALATIDQLVANQASELALAVHALSSAVTDDAQLAEDFDDSHVLCALNVLKIAGRLAVDRNGLEDKTRERLAVLAERVSAYMTREEEMAVGKKSSFSLPDSLSAVEIDSIVTRKVCSKTIEEEPSATKAVLQRLGSADRSAPTLYPEMEVATKRLAQSCHGFVFDVCSAVPRRHLNGMSSMAAWREESSADDVAAYGTLPQSYITHAGEHMLALVQALEPFASDPDSLALANHVMAGVRDVALAPWRDLVKASGDVASSDQVIRSLMDGKEIRNLVLESAVVEEEEEDFQEDATSRASAAFCNSWLDVVGLAVAGRLLERIMRIPSLTPKGCEHLHADLQYLVNVFSALGVAGHPHPLLGHLAELAIADGSVLAERIAARDSNNPLDKSLSAIEERLAAMRGVAAGYNY